MKFNFNPSKFNDLHFDLNNGTKRFQIPYGGAGASKSHSITSHLLIDRLIKYPNEKLLVIRKVGRDLKDSVIDLFIEYLERWNDETGFNFISQYNKNDNYIRLFNNSEILFKGLDDNDAKRLKSINGITCIWIEEADEITQAEFMQINLRLRGKGLRDPKIYISFNPVSELHFLKTYFFDESTVAEKCDTYFVTYKDNKFIDDDYKEELEGYKHTDPQLYNIYTLGNWGSISRDSIIYKNFDVKKHVYSREDAKREEYKFNPDLPLFISIDENYVPTSTILISQVEGNTINILDEIFVVGWELEKCCKELMNRYGNHPKILTGDASSKAGTSKLDRGVNTYTLVNKYVQGIQKQVVPSVTPPILYRTNWINSILHTDSIKIRINPKCKFLIDDLLNCKWDKDNKGKDKSTFNDKKHGMSYQRWGHGVDCMDYLLCSAFRKQFDGFSSGKKKIEACYRSSLSY